MDEILGAEGNVRVLRVLTHQASPLSRAEVARRAGLTYRGASRAIDRLFETGVIDFTGSGRGRQIQLRREHPLYTALMSLFIAEEQRESELLGSVKKVLEEFGSLISAAWIEGPVARGTDAYGDPLELSILASAGVVDQAVERIQDRLVPIEQRHDITIEVRPYTKADIQSLEMHEHAVIPVLGPEPAAFVESDELKKTEPFTSHAQYDRRSLTRASVLAELFLREPHLRERALEWLSGRLQEQPENRELKEWHRILKATSPFRLYRLLIAGNQRSARLRQSLPFWPILTDEEREIILTASTDES